jgi:hypothetical protein
MDIMRICKMAVSTPQWAAFGSFYTLLTISARNGVKPLQPDWL